MTTKKLEKMMEEMKRQNMTSLSAEMLDELREWDFILPAFLPQDISPELMRKVIDNQKKNLPLPEGVTPGACIIQNNQGESFVPLFTSVDEMNKGKNQFPLYLNVKFDAATGMVENKTDLTGVSINPFSHNVVMRLDRNKMQNQPEQTAQITVEQYHALARQQMEAAYLPNRLFEQKEEFIQKLCDEKGSLMREMYEELYQEEIACPYTEEDFEFLTLNISETFMVSRIGMPEKNRYPHLSKSVIYGFDREKNKIWYYAIVHEGKGKPASLVQVIESGEPKNLGEAPAEGSEISYVMDLMQAEV